MKKMLNLHIYSVYLSIRLRYETWINLILFLALSNNATTQHNTAQHTGSDLVCLKDFVFGALHMICIICLDNFDTCLILLVSKMLERELKR